MSGRRSYRGRRGSTRTVQRVALWADGPNRGELVLLGADLPQEIRDACREGRLICPVDGCADPTFFAAAGPKQVPHFRHHNGAGGHGDESEAHLQAKAVIAEWARRCAPDAVVEVERRSGERRPDVQVRSTAAGWSSAIEFQRSELSADRDDRGWVARQDALAAQHDHVIWLLDPMRVEGHPANRRAVVANELMRAMARRDLPVRVLDVAERRVTSILPWKQGKTLLEASPVYRGFAGTRATVHFLQFGAALDDCALVDGRMITPTDRRVAELKLDYRLDPSHVPRQRRPMPLPPPAPVVHDAEVAVPTHRPRPVPSRRRTPTANRVPDLPEQRREPAPRMETPPGRPAAPQARLPFPASPRRASTPAPPVAVRTEPLAAESRPPPVVVAKPQAPSSPPSPRSMLATRLVVWGAITVLAYLAGRLLGWW